MDFNALFIFLENLYDNNHKEWMDLNRKEFHTVRDNYIVWLNKMNTTFAAMDPHYFNTPGKKAINRINNNLMFHPNKPIYKDHIGAGLDQVSKQGDFYIHLGVNEIFIGGGYWHPSSKVLKNIRGGIDYNGDILKAIIKKPSFKKMFTGLVEDQPLKSAPKGYSKEHEHIDLLRRKSFAVARYFSREQVISPDFENQVVKTYIEMLPFRRYLNEAATVIE